MIITRLTLNNFRVFRGNNEIELAPRTQKIGINASIERNRPIILFGGLNGAGKTSILTAIRLALYGRQAFGKNLSSSEYINQLAELVHKRTALDCVNDKSSIELEFQYNQQGQSHTYKVTRSWKKGQKDKIVLEKNGITLSELNYDQSQGFLNELIPAGIADLFFFDGEKIAELAEDESGQVLQTAVRRLLGLDVIAKLKSDLAIFLKRKGAESASESVQNQILQLEQNCKNHEAKSELLREQALEIRKQIIAITGEIQQQEARLSSQGGAWASTREAEETKADFLVKEKNNLEKQLRQEMEASLPLAFAPNALSNLISKLKNEQQQKQKISFAQELEGFLDKLKQRLNFDLSESAPVAMEAVTDCFADYQAQTPKVPLVFDISERQTNRIENLCQLEATNSLSRFKEIRAKLSNLEEELAQTSANIARAPAEDQIENILNFVRELDKQKEKLVTKYRSILTEVKNELRYAQETARKIQKLHEKHKSQVNSADGVENAQNTLLMLKKFSKQLTELRVSQLEKEFISSYKRLARKEDLQYQASINPQTFDVELIDESGNVINRKAMSAGEKQIYAIAILEALGKTSGRNLPVIIDTPLGRLDSKHRNKLVEHYFPEASHQVVILSTDTEIDESYVETLQDDISHRFEICFDSKTKSSKVIEGYFWGQPAQEAM